MAGVVTPPVWEGAESLRPLLVGIDTLHEHPRNARRGDVSVIAQSLERFGQVRPVVVRAETDEIVAGNHTWKAARYELGWTAIAAVRVPMDEDEALAYLMADNRSSDLGRYDDDARISILSQLSERGKLEGTGYSLDDLDDIVAAREVALREMSDARTSASGDLPGRGDGGLDGTSDGQPGPGMKEVFLVFDPADHDQLGVWLKMLRKEYGTHGPSETVFRAVKFAAEQL